jgi:hypothetical protein
MAVARNSTGERNRAHIPPKLCRIPMDNVAHAIDLRERAEECRVLAEIAWDGQARASYLHAAKMYEALAAQIEARAEDGRRRPTLRSQVSLITQPL